MDAPSRESCRTCQVDNNQVKSAKPHPVDTARWSVHEFNVLALLKGNDRYIFVYDDESRNEVINAFRDQAAEPGLSLTWFDAVVLTKKAQEQTSQNTEPNQHTTTRY